MDNTLVFIAGLHRSGTSPLFNLLKAHPDISGFEIPGGAEREHEGQHLQTVYPPDNEIGGPGYFALDPSAHLTESSTLANSNSRDALIADWVKHWDTQKPYLLEKSPPNVVRTRFLQALFPGSKFILITRHPIAASLATVKWMGWPHYHVTTRGSQSKGATVNIRLSTESDYDSFYEDSQLHMESMIYTLFRNWHAAHRSFEDDSTYLSNIVRIRYEDLTENTDSVMKNVLGFIGASATDKLRHEDLKNSNTTYFNEWNSMLGSSISKAYANFLEQEFGQFFLEYGYTLDGNE